MADRLHNLTDTVQANQLSFRRYPIDIGTITLSFGFPSGDGSKQQQQQKWSTKEKREEPRLHSFFFFQISTETTETTTTITATTNISYKYWQVVLKNALQRSAIFMFFGSIGLTDHSIPKQIEAHVRWWSSRVEQWSENEISIDLDVLLHHSDQLSLFSHCSFFEGHCL